MGIERSYLSVSRFFAAWVRIMELGTRRMEAEDSSQRGSRILIVSPPTDPGIRLLARENAPGQTDLLCFSEELGRIARKRFRRDAIETLGIHVAPFFRLPFEDGAFAAIYANCFFDFCQEQDFEAILDEMWRVLSPKGALFAVYMGLPKGLRSKSWAWAFRRLHFLSQGCHPVSLEPCLSQRGFVARKDLAVESFGFPIRYVLSEKEARPG